MLACSPKQIHLSAKLGIRSAAQTSTCIALHVSAASTFSEPYKKALNLFWLWCIMCKYTVTHSTKLSRSMYFGRWSTPQPLSKSFSLTPMSPTYVSRPEAIFQPAGACGSCKCSVACRLATTLLNRTHQLSNKLTASHWLAKQSVLQTSEIRTWHK